MDTNTLIVKTPSNKLARWMIASDPFTKKESVLILKGKFPLYLFEIVPPTEDPECLTVEYKNTIYYVRVKHDLDKMGTPPKSYLKEMLEWYSRSKARPSLKEINSKSELPVTAVPYPNGSPKE